MKATEKKIYVYVYDRLKRTVTKCVVNDCDSCGFLFFEYDNEVCKFNPKYGYVNVIDIKNKGKNMRILVTTDRVAIENIFVSDEKIMWDLLNKCSNTMRECMKLDTEYTIINDVAEEDDECKEEIGWVHELRETLIRNGFVQQEEDFQNQYDKNTYIWLDNSWGKKISSEIIIKFDDNRENWICVEMHNYKTVSKFIGIVESIEELQPIIDACGISKRLEI